MMLNKVIIINKKMIFCVFVFLMIGVKEAKASVPAREVIERAYAISIMPPSPAKPFIAYIWKDNGKGLTLAEQQAYLADKSQKAQASLLEKKLDQPSEANSNPNSKR